MEQGAWLKIPKAARWRRPAAYRKIRKGGEELGKKATRVLMYQIRLEQNIPKQTTLNPVPTACLRNKLRRPELAGRTSQGQQCH